MLKLKPIKQATITYCSLILFLLIIISLWGSTYYMRSCIIAEQDAESLRTQLKALGIELADGSDYLTDEARKFVVTSDPLPMYNYWTEINITRTRDSALTTISLLNSTPNEVALLKEAKHHSDTLVDTETHAMRLICDTLTLREIDLPKEVRNYILPVHEIPLSPDLKKEKAIQLMYGEQYTKDKSSIMTPISRFQQTMNARLDHSLQVARQRTHSALILQIVLTLLSLMTVAIILYIFHRMFNIPISHYTRQLKGLNITDEVFKLSGEGTKELYLLADIFNTLHASFINEIQSRRTAEAHMKQAKEEAEAANQAKSLFLAHMSHEIRTPLHAIIGYEHLLMQSALTASQTRYIHSIKLASDNLLHIINQILDFSKIEADKLQLHIETFSLSSLLEELYEIFHAQAESKGLSFEIKTDDSLPATMTSDRIRLTQVLSNLLSNAIKFTTTGKVKLQLSTTSMPNNLYTITFEVIDTGIGITKEQQNTIFDSFIQGDNSTSRHYGGTGLGLTISKQIVCLLGGNLKLHSLLGEGSNFYFSLLSENGIGDSLPLPNTYSSPSAEEPLTSFLGQSLLIIDDDEVNLSMEKEILTPFDFKVQTAQSGKAALALLKEHSFHVILMDIRMADMDGYETTSYIRQLPAFKEIPIIAVTADATESTFIKAKQSGMSDLTTKPIDFRNLIELLKKYLPYTTSNKKGDPIDSTWQISFAQQLSTPLVQPESSLCAIHYNFTLYAQLLERFITTHHLDIKRLQSFLMVHDLKEATLLLHTLKGVVGHLGACILFEELVEFETFLMASPKPPQVQLWSFYTSIEELYKNTLKDLQHILSQLKAEGYLPSPIDLRSSHPDSQNSVTLLTTLQHYLEEGDLTALTYLDTYKANIRAAFSETDFQLLEDYIKQYDFEPSFLLINQVLHPTLPTSSF